MNLDALCHEIRTAPVGELTDLQALINAVASIAGDRLDSDEYDEELAGSVIERLDLASDAIGEIERKSSARACPQCAVMRDEYGRPCGRHRRAA